MDCSFGSKNTKCNIVFGNNYRSVGTISFQDSTNYNSVVKFPRNASYSLNNCFRGCTNFNSPITIPNGVTHLKNMFYECNNFNATVTVKTQIGSGGAASMFAFTNFNRNFTLGRQANDNSYFDVMRNCNNYKATLTVDAENMNFYGEIYDTNHYHWSGFVVINNGEYAGYVLPTVADYGIPETKSHLGVKLKFPYYQNAVVELVESPGGSFAWGDYCFKALNWGNLPQVPDVR